MTYQQILDRDVPLIVAKSKQFAQSGLYGKVHIYYEYERIHGVFEHEPLESVMLDGLTDSGVSIPGNIPWDSWNLYLRNRLGNVPLFAKAEGYDDAPTV